MIHKFISHIYDIPFDKLEHLAGLHDCKIEPTYPELGEENITYTISSNEVNNLYGLGVSVGREREKQIQITIQSEKERKIIG